MIRSVNLAIFLSIVNLVFDHKLFIIIKLRKYQTTDWEAICIIHDLARIDELTGSVDPGAFLTLEQAYENEGLFDSQLIVAELKKDVVGFIAYEPNEITWLYVHPKCYRQGIGTALIKEALSLCDNKIEIQVLTGNKSAFKLYTKLGFKVKEIKKGKLTGNEVYPAEAYILVLDKVDL